MSAVTLLYVVSTRGKPVYIFRIRSNAERFIRKQRGDWSISECILSHRHPVEDPESLEKPTIKKLWVGLKRVAKSFFTTK